jgi:GxxExxY protein
MEERDPETYAIIGAAMEVHRVSGRGFLERAYQEALAREFGLRGIPYQREVETPIICKGAVLESAYRADFVCCGNIVVELKAIYLLSGVETAQTINYTKAGGFHRALLINFGSDSLEYKRYVL